MRMKVFKGVTALGLVVFLFIGGFIVANSIDEELNPEIPALLERLSRPVPEEGNAYYYMVGMWAGPETGDIVKAGIAVQEVLRERATQTPGVFLEEQDYGALGYLDLDIGDLSRCGSGDRPDCVRFMRERRQDYARAMAQYRLLLARYDRLFEYERYLEPMPTGGPWTGNSLALHRLYLADIVSRWDRGERQPALVRLARAHEFWRRVASADTSLLTRMIAISILDMDYHVLPVLMDDCGDCRSYAEPLSTMLSAFSNDEFAMHEVFMREFAWIAGSLSELSGEIERELFGEGMDGFLLASFYKPNATLNSFHDLHGRLAQAFSLPPRDYLAARPDLEAYLARKSSPTLVDMYFNAVDSILAAIAIPDYRIYYERSFALEDRRRLIALRWRLRDEGIAADGVAAFLAGLDAEVYGSIATGKLPRHDADAGVLRFDYDEVNPELEMSVPL